MVGTLTNSLSISLSLGEQAIRFGLNGSLPGTIPTMIYTSCDATVFGNNVNYGPNDIDADKTSQTLIRTISTRNASTPRVRSR